LSSEPVILDLPGVQAIFRSESMKRLLQMVERVAHHNAAVLIIGETGSGKELIARAVHHHSLRCDQPWIDVNCGALPEHLVESELFGYEKGAFSGAEGSKPGFFELANKGTLFLDEVGELESKLQVKLLRVLDGVPYYRLGGTKKVTVDVRLVAATNQELEQSVREGRFRGDLYHRLSQFQLRVPPLRERKDDITLLAEYFLTANNPNARLSDEAAERLRAYRWPGNVRELRNVMERAVILAGEGTIERKHLPGFLVNGAVSVSPGSAPAAAPPAAADDGDSVRFAVGTTVEEAEKGLILRTLEHTRNNKTRAAEILGISLKTLHNKLKEYGGTAPKEEEAGA